MIGMDLSIGWPFWPWQALQVASRASRSSAACAGAATSARRAHATNERLLTMTFPALSIFLLPGGPPRSPGSLAHIPAKWPPVRRQGYAPTPRAPAAASAMRSNRLCHSAGRMPCGPASLALLDPGARDHGAPLDDV